MLNHRIIKGGLSTTLWAFIQYNRFTPDEGRPRKKNKYKKRISTSSDMAIVLFFFIAIRAVVPIVLIRENHQVLGEIVR